MTNITAGDKHVHGKLPCARVTIALDADRRILGWGGVNQDVRVECLYCAQ
jgi:hypothetical protein